jgi:CHAT domain-containing protein
MPCSEAMGLLVHEGSPGRGWQPITKVEQEARLVKESFEAAGAPITIVNETSIHPTVPQVLACLEDPDIRVLHLACHGAQMHNSLASAFILRDGDLNIQELMKLDLKRASLAFLSACQTAKGDQNQPDQAMHLAASLLFCGFKSAIATMW